MTGAFSGLLGDDHDDTVGYLMSFNIYFLVVVHPSSICLDRGLRVPLVVLALAPFDKICAWSSLQVYSSYDAHRPATTAPTPLPGSPCRTGDKSLPAKEPLGVIDLDRFSFIAYL